MGRGSTAASTEEACARAVNELMEIKSECLRLGDYKRTSLLICQCSELCACSQLAIFSFGYLTLQDIQTDVGTMDLSLE